MSIFGLASAVEDADAFPPASPEARTNVVVARFEPSESSDPGRRTEVAGTADAEVLESVRRKLDEADTRTTALSEIVDIVAAEPRKGGNDQPPPSKTAPQLLTAALGVLVLWIPAEIVAAYGAFVTMMQPADAGSPPNYSLPLWVIALIATPVFIWLTAWAKKTSGRKRSAAAKRKLAWSIVLAPIAFALWSAAIPASAWNLWEPFRENSAEFLFVLLIITGLFTLVASKVTGIEPGSGS
ncbi:hypothetical protein ACPW96_04140 [Micromonospora sp. DT81.3]|uniref:hypothetical protein n=1 Tax=Micromonospora sp. DT81.3 TaxID=3416523 RepID=UPI003CEBBB0C